VNVDRAPANLRVSLEMRRSGDTGRRRVEHRGFLQLWFTHNIRIRSDTTGARLTTKYHLRKIVKFSSFERNNSEIKDMPKERIFLQCA